MKKWFRKHYRMTSMLFLAVMFVGWTSFLDFSEGNQKNSLAASNDNKSVQDMQDATMMAKQEDTPANVPGSDIDIPKKNIPDNADVADASETDVANTPEANVTDTPEAEETDVSDIDVTGTNTTENEDIGTGSEGDTAQTADSDTEEDVTSDDDNPEDLDNPDDSVGEEIPDTGTGADNTDNEDETEEIQTLDITFKYAIANVGDKLFVRSGPGQDNAVIASMKPNAYCEVLEWGPEWTKIKSGGITGYSFTDFLLFNDECIEKLQNMGKLLIRVTSNTLNIRSAPNQECRILDKAYNNHKYMYLPNQSVEDWYCIQYSETEVGYMSMQYSEVFIDTSVATPSR